MIIEYETVTYIKTADIPKLLEAERGHRWSEAMVRAWIAEVDHPLIPARRGRPGQAHEFVRADVLEWYDRRRERELAAKIRARIARNRRLRIPNPGEECRP